MSIAEAFAANAMLLSFVAFAITFFADVITASRAAERRVLSVALALFVVAVILGLASAWASVLA